MGVKTPVLTALHDLKEFIRKVKRTNYVCIPMNIYFPRNLVNFKK